MAIDPKFVEFVCKAGCFQVCLVPTNESAKTKVIEVVKQWYPAPVYLKKINTLK